MNSGVALASGLALWAAFLSITASVTTTLTASVAIAGERPSRECGKVFHLPLTRVYFVNCHKEDEWPCEVTGIHQPFGTVAPVDLDALSDAACTSGPAKIPVRQKDGTLTEVDLAKVTVVVEQWPEDRLTPEAKSDDSRFSSTPSTAPPASGSESSTSGWVPIRFFVDLVPEANAGLRVIHPPTLHSYRGGEIVAAIHTPEASANRPLGLVVKPGARAKPLCTLTADDVVGTFEFHDPRTDLELLQSASSPKLKEMPTTAVERFIRTSTTHPATTPPGRLELRSTLALASLRCLPPMERLQAVRSLSLPGGMMDFSSGEGLTARRNEMFLIDGQAFNQRDFGNYAWAIGMRLAGYDYATIRTLAELNGAVGTYAQNHDDTSSVAVAPVPLGTTHARRDGSQYERKNRIIVAAGDSRPDQDAIDRGFHSAAADRLASALDREVEAAGCKVLRQQLQAPLDAWREARKDASKTN